MIAAHFGMALLSLAAVLLLFGIFAWLGDLYYVWRERPLEEELLVLIQDEIRLESLAYNLGRMADKHE